MKYLLLTLILVPNLLSAMDNNNNATKDGDVKVLKSGSLEDDDGGVPSIINSDEEEANPFEVPEDLKDFFNDDNADLTDTLLIVEKILADGNTMEDCEFTDEDIEKIQKRKNKNAHDGQGLCGEEETAKNKVKAAEKKFKEKQANLAALKEKLNNNAGDRDKMMRALQLISRRVPNKFPEDVRTAIDNYKPQNGSKGFFASIWGYVPEIRWECVVQ